MLNKINQEIQETMKALQNAQTNNDIKKSKTLTDKLNKLFDQKQKLMSTQNEHSDHIDIDTLFNKLFDQLNKIKNDQEIKDKINLAKQKIMNDPEIKNKINLVKQKINQKLDSIHCDSCHDHSQYNTTQDDSKYELNEDEVIDKVEHLIAKYDDGIPVTVYRNKFYWRNKKYLAKYGLINNDQDYYLYMITAVNDFFDNCTPSEINMMNPNAYDLAQQIKQQAKAVTIHVNINGELIYELIHGICLMAPITKETSLDNLNLSELISNYIFIYQFLMSSVQLRHTFYKVTKYSDPRCYDDYDDYEEDNYDYDDDDDLDEDWDENMDD